MSLAGGSICVQIETPSQPLAKSTDLVWSADKKIIMTESSQNTGGAGLQLSRSLVLLCYFQTQTNTPSTAVRCFASMPVWELEE